jgi:hypothetical protein
LILCGSSALISVQTGTAFCPRSGISAYCDATITVAGFG